MRNSWIFATFVDSWVTSWTSAGMECMTPKIVNGDLGSCGILRLLFQDKNPSRGGGRGTGDRGGREGGGSGGWGCRGGGRGQQPEVSEHVDMEYSAQDARSTGEII